jgi:hypothetical protein
MISLLCLVSLAVPMLFAAFAPRAPQRVPVKAKRDPRIPS